MSEAPLQDLWTWEAYLEWEAAQPVRHELVDGQVYAMVGGTAAHDIICNNLRSELRAALRGHKCRVQGPDLKVKAGRDVRYPDALIDCGPLVPGSVHAREPAAVFEVLSKSTAWIDQSLKLRAYDATPSIRHYVLINQDEPRAMIYTRDESGTLGPAGLVLLEGMRSSIELPGYGISIPFSAIYEGLEFVGSSSGRGGRERSSPT
jgi:Uma2 family endonuclease